MKVLSLSDALVPFVYSPKIKTRFQGVSLVLGCGDLPYYYQEYVISLLDVPLFFVRGNHDKEKEAGEKVDSSGPLGGVDLHRKITNHRGVLLAGVEGCLRYREGPFQYSQSEMWRHVISLLPGLLLNRILQRRYLDVFVTHAPPRGVHDRDDLPHRGIEAFRWLIETFKPAYHFHGHVHIYRPDTVSETRLGPTLVINTYGYREIELDLHHVSGK
jgi:Icc-related predicted phosphoesterase